ncbi:hypothetical protein WI91_19540 [Burkholderia vietnamiensis]|nr:hypothetical protein WI91_19540 [Burkholderia vietnamiensis]
MDDMTFIASAAARGAGAAAFDGAFGCVSGAGGLAAPKAVLTMRTARSVRTAPPVRTVPTAWTVRTTATTAAIEAIAPRPPTPAQGPSA